MLRLMTMISGMAFALAGCGNEQTEEMATPSPSTTREAPAPDVESGVVTALYTFDCGTIETTELDLYADDGSFAGMSAILSNSCHLIRHPKGDLLWDLGIPAAFAGNGPQSSGPFTMELERTLIDQMSDVGVTPEDIDFLAISHSHYDHTGQPEAAGEAVWLYRQAEYDYMFPAEPDPSAAALAGANDLFKRFESQLIDGDYDVFGDGAVRIMNMPGHTPGHSALLLNMAESGSVLLAADLYILQESREKALVPRINTNAEETRDSFKRFEALAEATGAMVIINHEPDDLSKLPTPPEPLR